ncbi:MAG: glycosyltransferase family 4 protein [Barnesiella sp.]|nr:glycosyltransferase family 4 protein [Bacteroidales bacterium]MBD5247253.1 glycosyltransferase family 4 protein [Barnesiella sp.]
MTLQKEYDFVFLTNTPSFYKLNLCKEITGAGKSLLLVLYGYGSDAVNKELQGSNKSFDFIFLHNGDINRRNKVKVFARLVSLMSKIKANRVLFSGWVSPEYNLYSMISPKKRNAIISESAIWDIDMRGIKGWIKRRIIRRMSAALPSGIPHKEFFIQLGYPSKCNITGSVGILNKSENKGTKRINHPLRYLFVGRLIELKNLRLLVDVFNRNGKPLTIVGAGELEKELKAVAKPNISFSGFVDNEKIGQIYQSHDVFILPSYSETWGLVVEEAIYWGLPVIVSNRVGCGQDMVTQLGTGVIFNSESADDLNDKISMIETNYQSYFDAVAKVDFNKRAENQVNAYIDLLQ